MLGMQPGVYCLFNGHAHCSFAWALYVDVRLFIFSPGKYIGMIMLLVSSCGLDATLCYYMRWPFQSTMLNVPVSFLKAVKSKTV